MFPALLCSHGSEAVQDNGSHFLGRWFLRQGWLLVVPPTGEPRPRMFFLFSDVLLMAKPRPPLHLLKSGTFVCRALYPMSQCQLNRVFGHSGGTCGGLLSVSCRWEIWASDILQALTDQRITWPGSLSMRVRAWLGTSSPLVILLSLSDRRGTSDRFGLTCSELKRFLPSCASPMRSYCSCPLTTRSCHDGTTA